MTVHRAVETKQRIITTGADAIRYDDTLFEDMRFPAFGRYVNIAAGHLSYNETELGIDFDDTSRYNDADQVAIICQTPHNWKPTTNLHPHVHYIQNQNATPNFLLKYRVYANGETPPAWTLAAWDAIVFSYTAGSILQIVSFPEIDMSTFTAVSIFIDVKLYRDTSNTSTLFAGADPYTGDSLLKEFDMHYEISQPGSRELYTF